MNNGLIVIDYDPEAVALEIDSALGLISANEIEEGHILIAFADEKTIPAGTVLATVSATLLEGATESVVYIAYKDGAATVEFDTLILGEATPEEQVSVNVTGAEWAWNEDHTAATVTLAIEGGDPLTLDAEIITKKTATCLLDGYVYYTALVRFNDTIYVDNYVEEVEASGHSYGEPEWAWEDDYSAAYLHFMCENGCGEDDWWIVFPAEITVEEHEPTCTEDGYYVLTATVDLSVYAEYAEMYYNYAAQYYYAGIMAGFEYYWSLYEDCMFYVENFGTDVYTDVKVVPGEAAHHTYEVAWTWAEDHSTATATFTCSACGDEQTVDAVITSEIVNGTIVYTATVDFEGETYTDTVTVAIAGDANGDGVLDGKDLIRLRKFLATYDPNAEEQETEVFPGADVNGDGKIDGRDLIALRKLLAAQE